MKAEKKVDETVAMKVGKKAASMVDQSDFWRVVHLVVLMAVALAERMVVEMAAQMAVLSDVLKVASTD